MTSNSEVIHLTRKRFSWKCPWSVGVEPTALSHNVLQHKDFIKSVGKNVGNKNFKASERPL